MILINGEPENRVRVTDRGLQYGDGVFETIAFRNDIAEFLDAHLQRLTLACDQLNIPFDSLILLQNELNDVLQSLTGSQAIIKIIITRGSGGRGYFADHNAKPSRIISTHPIPNYPKSFSEQGISVRYCQHPLSENKILSGIKHLNRLDQVLARNEWSDPNIAEGIMLDQHGFIIEGTMTNIFIVKSGRLITPSLTRSGVLGVMRAQVINLASNLGFTTKEEQVKKEDFDAADEAFVCNSINGIWPVTYNVNTKINYGNGMMTQKIQHALLAMKK